MAKKDKGPQNGGPIAPPDFEKAQRIYKQDVMPAHKAQKQAMKEAGDAWKAIKKDCRVHKGGYHKAMQVAEMEEAEQQAWLRSFKAGLDQTGTRLHADAVDIMEGVNAADLEVVPTGAPDAIDLPPVH